MKAGNRPIDQVYAEAIKPIRNRMRAYQYDSILDAFLRYINKPPTGNKVKDLERLPWVLERLILWLLSDNPSQYKNKLADDASVSELVHFAWDSISKLYKNHINIQSVKLFVRQLFLSQIPYQVNLDTHAFVLQLYVISRLASNSKLRKFLDERAGMPIEEYFQIALLFWTHTTTETPWFNEHYIKDMLPIFSEDKLNIFLNSITSRRASLQGNLSKRIIELDEWFQPVILYKTPCIFHENAIIPFGRPTLRRYFENLIGDWLEEENGQRLRDYDNLISDYVSFGLRRSKANFLDERQIKELTKTTQRVCDFLIQEEDGYILIEVKNKSLTKKVPSSSQPEPLKARLKATIISAKEQLDETREVCNKLLQFKDKICYRIIVTKSDLWLGDIKSILVEYDDSLPIWLMSLADIDHLSELVCLNKTTFSKFFQDLANRQINPELSVFTAGMLLEIPPYKLEGLPEHLSLETDKIFNEVSSKAISGSLGRLS